MKRLKKLVIILCSVCLCANALEVKQKQIGHFTQYDLSNGIISVSVVPADGGRISSFKMKDSIFDFIRYEINNVENFSPGQFYKYFYGRNFGGIRGVHAPGWPGLRFNNIKYDIKISEKDFSVSMNAVADGVEDLRVITLLPETTSLKVQTFLTNKRDQFIDMMIRLNGEYNAGKDGTIVFLPDKNQKIESINYILGTEEGRGVRPIFDNWVGLLDVSSKMLMIINFPQEDYKELLLWTGAGAGEGAIDFQPLSKDYYGFVGFNLMQKKKEIKPGDSVNSWQEHSLYFGFDNIDMIHEKVVIQSKSERRNNHKLNLNILAALPHKGDISGIKVELSDNSEKVLFSKELSFSIKQPGIAQNEEFELELQENKVYHAKISYKGKSINKKIEF